MSSEECPQGDDKFLLVKKYDKMGLISEFPVFQRRTQFQLEIDIVSPTTVGSSFRVVINLQSLKGTV